jgi:hypothetical protein
MTKTLTALLLVAATSIASADPRHILVLRAEGNADAATRAKVDAQVARLAKTLDGNVEIGEISFTDAAAAVGCSGSEAQCKDDVLSTMGVDELVSTSVSAMASGDVHIMVHRIPKGAPIKDAQTTVMVKDSLDAKVASDVGPIFGVKAPPATTPPPPTPTPTPTPVGAFGNAPPTTPTPTTTPGAPVGAFGNTPAPVQTAQLDPNPQPLPLPLQPTTEGRENNRALIGIAIGGSLLLTGIIFWAEASSTQGDINSAPTSTPADFTNLKNLEDKGDSYSNLGNILFVGGLVVSGVSGYFFWKQRRAGASQAMITPTLLDHGAGIAFTYGGLP